MRPQDQASILVEAIKYVLKSEIDELNRVNNNLRSENSYVSAEVRKYNQQFYGLRDFLMERYPKAWETYEKKTLE